NEFAPANEVPGSPFYGPISPKFNKFRDVRPTDRSPPTLTLVGALIAAASEGGAGSDVIPALAMVRGLAADTAHRFRVERGGANRAQAGICVDAGLDHLDTGIRRRWL